MIKDNRVSLWLGFFENEEDFRNYVKVSYDEDGNYIPSEFQVECNIGKYDLDTVEVDWISEECLDVESLLAGFSGDFEMIPQFKNMLKDRDVQKYNSIVLLYNYEYDNDDCHYDTLEFIGCASVSL